MSLSLFGAARCGVGADRRIGATSARPRLEGDTLFSEDAVWLVGGDGNPTLISAFPVSSGLGVEFSLLLSGRIRLTTSGRGMLSRQFF